MKRFMSQENGSTTVEFVLWLPLLVAVLIVAVDASVLYMRQSNLWQVSRDTARIVSRHGMTELVAEAYARTGSDAEARKLLETYEPENADGDDVRAMLLRAQVYTFIAQKKRGRATQAMQALAQIEPNLVAAFVMKGNPPELMKLARQVLAGAGMAPKMQMKRMR